MKQKIVINVSMKKGQKYRSKALQIAASVSGNVEKLSLEGDDKDKVEVVGEGVDPVELTNLLRKGFGWAQLETVSAVEEKEIKDDENENGHNSSSTEPEPAICWTSGWGVPYNPYCSCHLGHYAYCSTIW